MEWNQQNTSSTWYNSCMIRVWGPQTAATLLELVEVRLAEFGISIDPHVVAFVTDGASIMTKPDRLATCDH